MVKKENVRLHLLDALRGFLLLHMIAYHGMWNLVYLFGIHAPWYNDTPGYLCLSLGPDCAKSFWQM